MGECHGAGGGLLGVVDYNRGQVWGGLLCPVERRTSGAGRLWSLP